VGGGGGAEWLVVNIVAGILHVIAANARSIAESLHHTFHLMSVLANVLYMHLSVASNVNICLVCLLRLFYGFKISHSSLDVV